MGSVKIDSSNDRFTVVYNDGIKETFKKNFTNDNYHGDKGSSIVGHILDNGFTVRRYDGIEEVFHKNWLDDNFTGNSGTHINKNWLDDNYTTYNFSNGAYHESSHTNQNVTSSVEEWVLIHGVIGLAAGILQGVILYNIGFGLLRAIFATFLFACIVGGLLDDITQIRQNKNKKIFILKGVVGDLIGCSVAIFIWLAVLFA